METGTIKGSLMPPAGFTHCPEPEPGSLQEEVSLSMFEAALIQTVMILASFTSVTNDANEGPVPFWSNSWLTHWKHSCYASGSISKCPFRAFQMPPYGSVSV